MCCDVKGAVFQFNLSIPLLLLTNIFLFAFNQQIEILIRVHHYKEVFSAAKSGLRKLYSKTE